MLEQTRSLQVVVNSVKILTQLNSGQTLMVDPSCQGGVIICKRHHAELAGPGSAIGGLCDYDSGKVIPIGDLSIKYPESYTERQKAFSIRQKWFRVTQKAMENTVPLKRAKAILFIIEKYFGKEAIAQLPDDILAQLVGVLPKTVKMARQLWANQPQQNGITLVKA